ncbi:aminoglycoside 6-adenylyltransferase [Microlunatus speluncae]|uniref:aminoglycoside 6-adenylyltransferase n=1 Tax=Microlunatus speluncae TaxID=2594267 RepID=UPI001266075E|nr:aminoglycoside 6-adenylyltransferase [Microlunatus speluncae]
MGTEELLRRITTVLDEDPRVRAAWLVGSYGRGTQDEFSDIDVWLVADDRDGLATDWADLGDRIAPSIYRERRDFGPVTLFNHVTPEWYRLDFTITGPDAVPGRARNLVRPLLDRDDLAARLGPPAEPLQPDPGNVERLIKEFFRVLGLTPVVLGRADLITAASGAGLLRDLLINLMLEDVAVPDRGGALHTSALLPPDRREQVERLPAIEATRESAVAVHRACTELFLPLARDLAARTGVTWPDEFARAALARVRPLGADPTVAQD